ncbi:hypothetical protein DPMN_059050 [Dreissena polymorpha]|uniref:Uncharacterized protein n=2 Tax=Dreissena polymorpha TaxID=45954 RepID=A0A9D4HG67_DREPO|nr:hypothetical protein DPMN_059050 [Dreissena polymorpha]
MGVCASVNSQNVILSNYQSSDALIDKNITDSDDADSYDSNNASINDHDHSSNVIVSVIVDIGTSFSSCIYTIYDRETDSVTEIKSIIDNEPTVLILNADNSFIAFGNSALDAITNLHKEDSTEFRIFMNFKPMLHRMKGLSSETLFKEHSNKTLNAIDVFCTIFKHLKAMVKIAFEETKSECHIEDVKWVYTIPAVWNDAARQFMHEAAERAGLDKANVKLLIETEVASTVFRVNLDRIVELEEDENDTDKLPVKYMVANIGGGIVEICVHVILEENKVGEMHMASGGTLGGSTVDGAYILFWESLVGRSLWQNFKEQSYDRYMSMVADFQSRKGDFTMNHAETIQFPIEPSLIKLFLEMTGEHLEHFIQNKFDNKTIRLEEDTGNLIIQPALMEMFFMPSIKWLISRLHEIKDEVNDPDLDTLVLTGGFSRSPYLRSKIDNEFPDMRILSLEEIGLTAMQGAIMMAHLPGDVTYRRSQYTYGFDVTVPFIDGDHPEELKFSEGGLNWCNGVFDKVIERNQIVEVGQIFTRSRNGTALDPARKHEERYTSLWRSTRDNPRFCLAEEGVEEVGVIVMKPPTEGWPDRWESENQVIVEETGLTVKRINRNTGEQSEILMTFL